MKRYKFIIILFALIVVVGVIIGLFTIKPALTVVSVEPDPALPLTITPTFVVTLNRQLPNTEDVEFIMSLNTDIAIAKSEAVYTIVPKITLSPETTYVITIMYKNQTLKQETYITKTITKLSEQEQQSLQSQADTYYAEQLNRVIEERPWITKLPLITSKYTVIYNSETGGVAIYQKQPIPDSERAQILETLLAQQIPTSPILWITPTPSR